LPVALLIGVAWSASIGGMGTPVGTPTNLIVIGYLEREFGIEVSFVQWMALGIPTVLLLIPAAWLILTRGRQRIDASLLASGGREVIAQARADLGGWTVPEVRTAIVFGLTALAWIIREPVSGVEILGVKPFAGVTDAVIAIMGAITCFLVPSGSRKEKGTALLEWKTAESIPWGALILFGGGLSLAGAFSSSGLADWLGESFSWVTLMAAIAVIAIMTTVVIFATELMSNVAIATTMMPIMGALAVAGGVDPMLLAAPVGLAASCAFMLPLGTAPNAIVFATGRVTIPTMARLGLWLNFVGIVVITLVCYFLVPLVH
jgi:sodium-dependent dicarboxylate transporter 2/3/5